MASIWYGIAFSLGTAFLGWFLSPVISFVLNKILSYLYDASQKAPDVVSNTISNLKYALTKVEEQWMLKKLPPNKSSGMFSLDQLECLRENLKNALYEVEDIIDLIDYHRIDKIARCGEAHEISWLQWCWWRLCNPNQETSAPVLQRVQHRGCCLGRCTHTSGALPPVHGARASSFDLKNCCRTMYRGIKYPRDCSYKFLGFEGYKQDVDCAIMGPLCIRLKKNMKGIEKLFDEASKCTSFKRRVKGIVEQENQSESNGSGNTPYFAAKAEQTTAYSAMEVIGREEVRRQISSLLRDHLSESVIGICGIPGSGKTTLAQYVYQLEKNEGHFNPVMWIHVSKKWNMDDIFKKMLEETSTNENAGPPFSSHNAMLTILLNRLNRKRFLLVLDDIWDNNVLHNLVSPLMDQSIGSKILVTSRTENALQSLGPALSYNFFPIPTLDDNDFFKLLMHYARADTSYGSPVHTIGREIAEKLKGSPLAARLVGSILSKSPGVGSWRRVGDRKLLDEEKGVDVWWCYHRLDEHVRRCFAYCSIFPRGFHLFRDDLVNLWVAHGFVRNTTPGEELEDIAEEYFDELVKSSFLQPGGMHEGAVYYLLHDVLHELAEEVAGTDCVRIENSRRWSGGNWICSRWQEEVPRGVHHLFVLNYDEELITGKILATEDLRTLIIYNVSQGVPFEDRAIESIFQKLQKLRVLAIAFNRYGHYGYNMISGPVSVPPSVSQSKHLRYLALRTCKRRVTFPRTPTKLYHLRLLDVGDAEDVEFSSSDLSNLRHVLGRLLYRIPNMGMMKSLQTRPYFRVREEQGYEVTQLRDLNKIRGSLSISGLENVKSKVDALEANLAEKKQLRELKLEWSPVYMGGCPEVEAQVLEGLCPPTDLETLRIFSYRGLSYPNWMSGMQNGGPKYLRKLQFSFCQQTGPAPKLEAFIHLHSLELNGCRWETLPSNMEQLTSLKVLRIVNCSEIWSLPALPQSIEEFTVGCCNTEFMTSCKTNGHSNWQKIEHIHQKCITASREKVRALLQNWASEATLVHGSAAVPQSTANHLLLILGI